MAYVRDPKQPELQLKAFARQGQAGAPANAAQPPQVVAQVIKNWFPIVESRLTVRRPLGYIVPASQQAVIITLLDHGIRLSSFPKDTALEVETCLVTEIVPSKEDYVAPEKISVAVQPSKFTARKGDIYVSMEQPAANLIPCLLEPQSEYGLIRYQMYELAPPQGSAFPLVRVVKRKPAVVPYTGAAPGK